MLSIRGLCYVCGSVFLLASAIATWATFASLRFQLEQSEIHIQTLRHEIETFEQCHASDNGTFFISKQGSRIWCNWPK